MTKIYIAHKPSKSIEKEIRESIEDECIFIVDKNIVGGIKIVEEDTIFDRSLETQIKKLSNFILEGLNDNRHSKN